MNPTDRYTLHLGDCLEFLRQADQDSVDSIVTDPPYGLSFMGKDWDNGVPGVAFWSAALRVAKPGAHLLAFGGTRTFHRQACAIEDAGWEIRDCVMWVYGSGFPKSHDVSKAIDREAGAEREIVGTGPYAERRPRAAHERQGMTFADDAYVRPAGHALTAPATPAAAQWAGWGTALKPAWEPVIVARKPLEGTVAQNVLKWGTGGLNIDAARIAACGAEDYNHPDSLKPRVPNKIYGQYDGVTQSKPNAIGRWPANVIHDGARDVVELFPESSGGAFPNKRGKQAIYGGGKGLPQETGTPAHPMSDVGSAARFFYCAKASKTDRDEGLDGIERQQIGHNMSTNACGRCGKRIMPNGSGDKCECGDLRETIKFPAAARNHHPTVKPSALMRYLVRLVTPPGGLVLAPFAGSGSTGKAALLEGFRFIGCEIDPGYFAIAEKRIAAAAAQLNLFDQAGAPAALETR